MYCLLGGLVQWFVRLMMLVIAEVRKASRTEEQFTLIKIFHLRNTTVTEHNSNNANNNNLRYTLL